MQASRQMVFYIYLSYIVPNKQVLAPFFMALFYPCPFASKQYLSSAITVRQTTCNTNAKLREFVCQSNPCVLQSSFFFDTFKKLQSPNPLRLQNKVGTLCSQISTM